MIKAIFFDIDGTLVSEKQGTYTEEIKNAIVSLKDAGYLLFIATGRAPSELKLTRIIGGLYFDGFVCSNGQYCYNHKETIYINAMDKGDIRRLVD